MTLCNTWIRQLTSRLAKDARARRRNRSSSDGWHAEQLEDRVVLAAVNAAVWLDGNTTPGGGGNGIASSLTNFFGPTSYSLVTTVDLETPGFLTANGFNVVIVSRFDSAFGDFLSATAAANIGAYVGLAGSPGQGGVALFTQDAADSFFGSGSGDPFDLNLDKLFTNAVQFAADTGHGYIGELNGAIMAMTSNTAGATPIGLLTGTASGVTFAPTFVYEVGPIGPDNPIDDGVIFPFTALEDSTYRTDITGADPNNVVLIYGDNDAPAVLANEVVITGGGNVCPTIDSLTLDSSSISENDTAILNGSFTDPDEGQSHTVVIDWADDNSLTPTTIIHLLPGEFTFSASHQYLDDGIAPGNATASDVYAVSVTVADDFESEPPLVSNGSFETNDLTGWSASGPASVVTSYAAEPDSSPIYSPIDGSYFALLTGGDADVYTSISQTITVVAGETISGWAFYDTNDYSPFEDDSAVSLQVAGPSTVATLFSASTFTVGDYGETHWTPWSYTFTMSGTYTLVAQVRNTIDNIRSPHLGLDFIGQACTDTDSVELTVANVAPEITECTGPTVALRGAPYEYGVNFTDVGTLDVHTATIDWGDGSPIEAGAVVELLGAGSATGTHTYAANGVYTITFTVTDDDGGSDTIECEVKIVAITIGAGCCDPDSLLIGGTDVADKVRVVPQGKQKGTSSDVVKVLIDGVDLGNWTGFSSITIYGYAGNDDLEIAGGIKKDACLYGFAGNDRIKGGSGSNILVGGDNNDTIIADTSSGYSLLIGGNGSDRLIGNGAGDILIAGYTDYDNPFSLGNQAALCAIGDAWATGATNKIPNYNARKAVVSGLLAGHVHDDSAYDQLTGSSGLDLFYANLTGGTVKDTVTGKLATETCLDEI